MAFFEVDFYSKSLAKVTGVNVILPNDVLDGMKENNRYYEREMQTLYLLHGYSGSNKDWVMGTVVQELAVRYNLAVVMPSGDNSFYLDGKGVGRAYCQYVGKELVEFIRSTFGLSEKKEDTFIGGCSMGGFGAIHAGMAFPETFGKILSFSSALIIHSIKNKKEDFVDGIADYDYYALMFGDLGRLEQSVNNPEYLIRGLKKEGKIVPPIFMACGTEDFLLEENRAFYKFLQEEKVDVVYQEGKGDHDWNFWNQSLGPALEWLMLVD